MASRSTSARWPISPRSCRRRSALGIKVIQDQVANHSGPYHPWVTDPPTPTWFNGTAAKHLANTWQTWTLQDPHATPQAQRDTLDGWFIDILPDLNQDDDEVARYIIQNSLWWVGVLGLDGIRQDTWPYVPRAFWHRWMDALKREYPQLTAVGELYDGDPALVSFFAGGARAVRRRRHEGRLAVRFSAVLRDSPRVCRGQAGAGSRADARRAITCIPTRPASWCSSATTTCCAS